MAAPQAPGPPTRSASVGTALSAMRSPAPVARTQSSAPQTPTGARGNAGAASAAVAESATPATPASAASGVLSVAFGAFQSMYDGLVKDVEAVSHGVAGGQAKPQLPLATRFARSCVKSGYLRRQRRGDEEPEKVFAVLRPATRLYFFYSEGDWEPRDCLDIDRLANYSVHKVGADEEHAFEVQHPQSSQRALRLEADSEDDVVEWIDAIAHDSYFRIRHEKDALEEAYLELQRSLSALERRNELLEDYAEQRHKAQDALDRERRRRASAMLALGNAAVRTRELVRSVEANSAVGRSVTPTNPAGAGGSAEGSHTHTVAATSTVSSGGDDDHDDAESARLLDTVQDITTNTTALTRGVSTLQEALAAKATECSQLLHDNMGLLEKVDTLTEQIRAMEQTHAHEMGEVTVERDRLAAEKRVIKKTARLMRREYGKLQTVLVRQRQHQQQLQQQLGQLQQEQAQRQQQEQEEQEQKPQQQQKTQNVESPNASSAATPSGAAGSGDGDTVGERHDDAEGDMTSRPSEHLNGQRNGGGSHDDADRPTTCAEDTDSEAGAASTSGPRVPAALELPPPPPDTDGELSSSARSRLPPLSLEQQEQLQLQQVYDSAAFSDRVAREMDLMFQKASASSLREYLKAPPKTLHRYNVKFTQQRIGLKLTKTDAIRVSGYVNEPPPGAPPRKPGKGAALIAYNGTPVHNLSLRDLAHVLKDTPRPLMLTFEEFK